MAKKLGLTIEPYNIQAIHRIYTRETDKVAPVIVRMNNRTKKTKLVKYSNEKRLEGIFVSNHLSTQSQYLLAKARDLKRSRIVKFAWEADGKIFTRKNEKTKAIQSNPGEERRYKRAHEKQR